MTATRNYVKVPPNKVAVFYGRKHVTPDGRQIGFRLVTGGARFKWPLLEDVTSMDLMVFPIDLDVKDVPNKDGVPVSVQGVANVKIRNDEQSLIAAAERFLGLGHDDIKEIAYKNLEGHLRSIVGRLTVEEIVRDRQKFDQEVLAEAASDLARIGLGVDVLTVQKIEDKEGYIQALGKKRTAEVKRDATIGEASASREATISATTALREAKERENENLALIAQAEKERDVRKAQYEAEVQAQAARAKQAGPLAEARARQEVVEQEVPVDLVRARPRAPGASRWTGGRWTACRPTAGSARGSPTCSSGGGCSPTSRCARTSGSAATPRRPGPAAPRPSPWWSRSSPSSGSAPARPPARCRAASSRWSPSRADSCPGRASCSSTSRPSGWRRAS